MLRPTSIFRRMPGVISLSQRRLLGALAYANDSAELSFARLKEAARAYHLPTERIAASDRTGTLPRYPPLGLVRCLSAQFLSSYNLQ